MTPVESFCEEYFTYNGISDDRRAMVRRVLRDLGDHAGTAPHEVDEGQFMAFLTAQVKAGLHVNTVRKHANALRPFFEWAWRQGLIDDGRLMRLRSVKNPRGSTGQSTPRPYTRKQLEQFWAQLAERWPLDEEGKWTRRWILGRSRYVRVWRHATRLQTTAVVRLALDCGLRRTEIRMLGVDDVHPDNAYVMVRHGKGGKEREVPFTEAARAAVGRWLEYRTLVMEHFGAEHDSVWLNLNPIGGGANNPLAPAPVGVAIGRGPWKEILTTIGPWELHRFRHTCATERLRAGMKLENLSRFLGHASIQQTLAYAEIVRDDIHRDALRTEAGFAEATREAA